MALHATFFELVETTDCLSFSSPSARRMDFETFIFSLSDSDILRFLRSILEEVEVTRGIMDYHLRVQPCPITGGFAIIIHFNQRRRPPKNRENCMSCDLSTPHFESFVSSDFMLSEFEYTRTWLDLAARPMYIVTPIQHAERASSLGDATLLELFRRGVWLVQQFSGGTFQDMRLNHGNYRNHEHLHLKVCVPQNTFLSRWECEPVYKAALREVQRKRGERRGGPRINAVDLGSVCLRKVAPPVQPPTVSSAAVDRELYLNQRLRACDLESWYPQLQQFTFPALFIPLSPIEATAIVAQYWQLKARHSVSHDSSLALEQLQARIHVAGLQLARIGAVASLGQSLGQPQDQAQGVGDSGGGAAPTASREPSVSINTLPVGGSEVVHRDCSPATSFPSVFVKLSCRSPKDSLGRQERARELALSQLQDWSEAHPGETADGNTLAEAVYYGTTNCLRLNSAEEVLHTLCTSERVCEDDIPLALGFPTAWSQHIVLRPWRLIGTENEFRAFVVNGQLTGLCQYFSSAFFPALPLRKAEVLACVQRFFATVQPLVPLVPADYVMDLAVDVNSGSVHVIELNPFGPPDGMGTGAVMFNLDVPEDKAILFGEAPFQFRVVESPVPGVSKLIKGKWRTFLQKEGFIQLG